MEQVSDGVLSKALIPFISLNELMSTIALLSKRWNLLLKNDAVWGILYFRDFFISASPKRKNSKRKRPGDRGETSRVSEIEFDFLSQRNVFWKELDGQPWRQMYLDRFKQLKSHNDLSFTSQGRAAQIALLDLELAERLATQRVSSSPQRPTPHDSENLTLDSPSPASSNETSSTMPSSETHICGPQCAYAYPLKDLAATFVCPISGRLLDAAQISLCRAANQTWDDRDSFRPFIGDDELVGGDEDEIDDWCSRGVLGRYFMRGYDGASCLHDKYS